MMRIVAAVVVVGIVGVVGWFAASRGGGAEAEAPPAPATVLLSASDAGVPSEVDAALAAGAPTSATDAFGRTPLMRAAAAGHDDVVRRLLTAGADVNARSAGGWTALMFAADAAPSASTALLLLNAGADPHVRDADGVRAVDLAADHPPVRGSGLFARLQELSDGFDAIAELRGGAPFAEGWPSMYVVPIDGATLSSRASHLPGAPRRYRNGTHEGFDFYDGTVSVEIAYGTPQRAVAAGTVVRADVDYAPLTQARYDALIEEATSSLTTPPDVLDALRGRQVWIRHAGGFVSRYAHLSGVAEGVVEGARVAQGATVGFTGNSGTSEAAAGTEAGPHPHVEIWRDATYLGAGMEPPEIYAVAAQVFGLDALPPFTDGGLTF